MVLFKKKQENTKSEEYIIDEAPEISLGENPTWGIRIKKAFPAFKSRNYRLYFSGQLISLIGTWLQVVAEGWLVLQLTQSPLLIGLVAASASVPSLLLSLFGGVIVDHFPKKRIMLFTQSSAMILAIIYGLLTIFNVINIYEIMILAFLLGVVHAIDSPARQAYVTELVDKDALASGIALNSGTFNAARVIGPSVAGLLIAVVGTGGAFIINGLSYLAVIVALLKINTPMVVNHTHIKPFEAIKEGLRYVKHHLIIRTMFLFTAVLSIFGWSYMTIIPIIAQNTFRQNAAGLGYMYAAIGVGALLATFLVSALSQKIDKQIFIFCGTAIFGIALIFFSMATNFILALGLLFLVGFGLLLLFTTISTVIQSLVEDNYRGRVMSIYSLIFVGLIPLGNMEIGFLTEHFGHTLAISVGAVLVLLSTVILYTKRSVLRPTGTEQVP